jgi:lactoylglutathione lyase
MENKMNYKMIHVCLRVLDLDASERFYKEAFGFIVSRKRDYPGDFTLTYMTASGAPFELELTYNYDRSEPYVMGDGYSHIAVGVDDLDESYRQHATAGFDVTPLKSLPGSPPQFYFITDPDGYKVEVVRNK